MEQIIAALVDYGMAGIILAILLFYLNKLTNIHRDERKEWQDANNRHVEKFAEVIEKNTQAYTELRSEVKDNKCKMV
jgi:hypothetical protein